MYSLNYQLRKIQIRLIILEESELKFYIRLCLDIISRFFKISVRLARGGRR